MSCQKEPKAPPRLQRPSLRLGFPVLLVPGGCGIELPALTAFAPVRQQSRVSSRSTLRVRPPALRCSAPPNGATAGKRRNGLKSGLFGIRLLPRSEAPSSARASGAGDSPLQALTPPDCLTAVSAANGGSFGRAGAGEQRRESWPQARTRESGQAAFPHLAKTKWGRGAGAKRPAGSHFNDPSGPSDTSGRTEQALHPNGGAQDERCRQTAASNLVTFRALNQTRLPRTKPSRSRTAAYSLRGSSTSR